MAILTGTTKTGTALAVSPRSGPAASKDTVAALARPSLIRQAPGFGVSPVRLSARLRLAVRPTTTVTKRTMFRITTVAGKRTDIRQHGAAARIAQTATIREV